VPGERKEAVMTKDDRDANGLLVQVCIQCGKEYMFEEQEVPTDLACTKCGSSVFRSFVARTAADDVHDDFRSSTERDTLTTDPATDITRGDLHDLGNA
jgi:DNA-directed RNA polymerase subunit RPC12/RpoP